MADNVLMQGVRGVTDLIVKPGLINLDFADIETVMKGMGKAMMGTGEAEGDKRAVMSAEAALSNPLIDDYSLKGAKGLLINITGGNDITLLSADMWVILRVSRSSTEYLATYSDVCRTMSNCNFIVPAHSRR